MTIDEISNALRIRANFLGIAAADVANRAGCSVEDANRVLSGDAAVTARVLLGVADALGYAVVAVPRPAQAAVAAGAHVTEPKVLTRVAAALATLQPPRVALFLDFDGVLAPVGASRIDDRGQVAGDGLFRWWPQLREVLDEHPDVQVVVHSSWRRFWPSLDWLRPILPPDLADRIVGVTDPDVFEKARSIETYLAVHPEVKAHVVLDDEGDTFAPDTNLVLCHPQRGLGDAAVVAKLREAIRTAKHQAAQDRTLESEDSANEFCSDLDEVLAYLRLGDRTGLAFAHRAQDLQSFLLHREAVKRLRADPKLVARAEATLARWVSRGDGHSQSLLARWREIIIKREWDAALANTDEAQQLRQASPLASVLPDCTRLAIIGYVSGLKRK
jgi:transcriptional regulator with XRE-family HTH domain